VKTLLERLNLPAAKPVTVEQDTIYFPILPSSFFANPDIPRPDSEKEGDLRTQTVKATTDSSGLLPKTNGIPSNPSKAYFIRSITDAIAVWHYRH